MTSQLTTCPYKPYFLLCGNCISGYPGSVVESVERGPRSINCVVPGRVKPMNCKINAFLFLDRRSTLLGLAKDWLAQCQDNVTELDIGS